MDVIPGGFIHIIILGSSRKTGVSPMCLSLSVGGGAYRNNTMRLRTQTESTMNTSTASSGIVQPLRHQV